MRTIKKSTNPAYFPVLFPQNVNPNNVIGKKYLLTSYLEVVDTLVGTVVDKVVLVGVETLVLDELEDVLLDTLVVTDVGEVVVVGVDTLVLDENDVEVLELTLV